MIGETDRPQRFDIEWPTRRLRLAAYRMAPRGAARAVALYVHGATFPVGNAVGWRWSGPSWLQALAADGIDAWAFDFAGYGNSDRYPEMADDPARHPPLGTVAEAADQLAQVAAFVRRETGGAPLSLIAHSWGTMVAGTLASQQPAVIERLVLFGPICERRELPAAPALPAWRTFSAAEQRQRFLDDVAAGEPPAIEEAELAAWLDAYLASDRAAAARVPPAVAIPTGPLADIGRAWAGSLPWQPATVRSPVLLITGASDALCRADDRRWLQARLLQSPEVWDLEIAGGGHLLHLERGRAALRRTVSSFLLGRA